MRGAISVQPSRPADSPLGAHLLLALAVSPKAARAASPSSLDTQSSPMHPFPAEVTRGSSGFSCSSSHAMNRALFRVYLVLFYACLFLSMMLLFKMAPGIVLPSATAQGGCSVPCGENARVDNLLSGMSYNAAGREFIVNESGKHAA